MFGICVSGASRRIESIIESIFVKPMLPQSMIASKLGRSGDLQQQAFQVLAFRKCGQERMIHARASCLRMHASTRASVAAPATIF